MHGNSTWYTRISLTLVDKVLNGSFQAPTPSHSLCHRIQQAAEE
jgi:hypothetical protein